MIRKDFLLKLLVYSLLLFTNCIKEKSGEKAEKDKEIPIDINTEVRTKAGLGNNFEYKVFYQELNQSSTRRGLVILAVGDGGSHNDVTLNVQCEALAQKGFVALTTTYRSNSFSGQDAYKKWMAQFKADIEQIIKQETESFNITRDKVVIGGLSRGGNLLLGSILPLGQMDDIPPITGIKGVILECAGGDQWKGSAILFPVLFMSNVTDSNVGTDAEAFKNGLQSNTNPNVKDKSKTLIIPGQGHCTGSAQYKDFIVKHIDSWF